jgi:hypothetical protein
MDKEERGITCVGLPVFAIAVANQLKLAFACAIWQLASMGLCEHSTIDMPLLTVETFHTMAVASDEDESRW